MPPSIVREMSRDAFLKVVFHDGVNIHTVTHVGRYRPAELSTALELGGPPEFQGVRCSVCGQRFRLQWDHVTPVCGWVTSFENEDPSAGTATPRRAARSGRLASTAELVVSERPRRRRAVQTHRTMDDVQPIVD